MYFDLQFVWIMVWVCSECFGNGTPLLTVQYRHQCCTLCHVYCALCLLN